MMTRQSFDDLESFAEAWNNDEVLRDISPAYISSLAPNPIDEIATADFDKHKARYLQILNVYQKHPDWIILKEFLKECIEPRKNRPIMEAEGEIPMATCLPVSNKLFIDTKLQIGVCEKFSDSYRIGNIKDGINWQKSNDFVKTYYERRNSRCKYFVQPFGCAISVLLQWSSTRNNGISFAAMNKHTTNSTSGCFVKWQNEE